MGNRSGTLCRQAHGRQDHGGEEQPRPDAVAPARIARRDPRIRKRSVVIVSKTTGAVSSGCPLQISGMAPRCGGIPIERRKTRATASDLHQRFIEVMTVLPTDLLSLLRAWCHGDRRQGDAAGRLVVCRPEPGEAGEARHRPRCPSSQASRNASRSALMWSACTVAMPCG